MLGDDEIAILLVDLGGSGVGGAVEELPQRRSLRLVDGVPGEPTGGEGDGVEVELRCFVGGKRGF